MWKSFAWAVKAILLLPVIVALLLLLPILFLLTVITTPPLEAINWYWRLRGKPERQTRTIIGMLRQARQSREKERNKG